MNVSKYVAIFKIQITNRWAYAGDLVTQSVTIVMFMWIFLQLWRTTFNVSGTSTLAGLSLRDTLWYLMIAETIMLSKPRLSRSISQSVKDGSIAYILNKPYHFLLYQMSIGLGDMLTHTLFNALAGGLTVWLLVGPPPAPQGLFLVLPAIFLAWLIDFWINSMIGLAAFITEDVSAFEWIYSKFLLLLGGVLIPLDFFPAWLQSITRFLPFSYTIYGPARLFVEPTMARFFNLTAIQIVWVLVFGLMVILFYRRGIRWLSINGG
jgi:ABC-2 type transport system permease protein